jgi:hypothetical protein
MDKVIKAVKEASISIACLLDEPNDVTVEDLEHIQKQVTIIENFLEPFTVAELEELSEEKSK